MKHTRKHILTRSQFISAIILVVLLVAARVFLAVFSNHEQQVTPDIDEPDVANNIKQNASPIYFDPNTSDSLTLLHNGLKPWQIRNLMKYRAKGGRYRSPEDFRRLYGLSDSAFRALKPYIRIDSTQWLARRDSLYALRHERDSLRHVADSLRRDSLRAVYHTHLKKDTLIELNAADTASLQYIKGIGQYTAIQIIKRREQLGGYVSPAQIREIGALADRADLDSILIHLTANPDSVRRIPVNTASVDRLQRHPYISFTQAKAIYTLRRNRFTLHSIDELRNLEGFTDSLLLRLEPYLSFESPNRSSQILNQTR